MKHENTDLYIFTHVPKCGGYNFNTAIQSRLPDGTVLPLRAQRKREAIDNYIGTLSPEQKNAIRCMTGHGMYYGIHHQLRREGQYITIIRDPLNKAISFYNYFHDRIQKKGYANVSRLAQNILDNNMNSIPFEHWYERYSKILSLTGFFKRRGYLERKQPQYLTQQVLQNFVDKFTFIATVETYEEDMLSLCSLLQIPYQQTHLNKSSHIYNPSAEERNELRAQFAKKLLPDTLLYNYVVDKRGLHHLKIETILEEPVSV